MGTAVLIYFFIGSFMGGHIQLTAAIGIATAFGGLLELGLAIKSRRSWVCSNIPRAYPTSVVPREAEYPRKQLEK